MATKAKTLQVKDKEKDDKAADAPENGSERGPGAGSRPKRAGMPR